jgi:hypothetical protein
MTGWDILSNVVNGFPPVAMALLLIAAIAAAIVFVIGFSRNGIDFVKHGFMQSNITELGEKIDGLRDEMNGLRDEVRGEISGLRTEVRAEISGLRDEFRAEISGLRDEVHGEISGLRTEVRGEISGLRTELETIKVNHFGHLKNFLTELTSILLDKGIINNENKARLDNHLRDM